MELVESERFYEETEADFFHDGAIGRFQGIKRASFWPVRAGGWLRSVVDVIGVLLMTKENSSIGENFCLA